MAFVTASPTGQAFLSAVYRRNWSIALLHINGTNMYEMLRLLAQIHRDDLANLMQTLSSMQFSVNVPRIVFACDVVTKKTVTSRSTGDVEAPSVARQFLALRSPLQIMTDPTSVLPAPEPGKAGLTLADFDESADELGVERAIVQAVSRVESGGRTGFGADGRCIIRYELHVFQGRTHGVHSKTHPHLSNAYKAGLALHGKGQQNEWSLMYGALMLRRCEDAVASASWGMFQIMGFNYKAAGYGSALELASAMSASASKPTPVFCALLSKQRVKQAAGQERLGWLRREV